MLNWIWAALIVVSFGFAITADVSDVASDRFRNGAALPVALPETSGDAPPAEGDALTVTIDAVEFRAFYAAWDEELAELDGPVVALTGTYSQATGEPTLSFPGEGLPAPLAAMFAHLEEFADAEALTARVTDSGLEFPPIKLRKMATLADAAFFWAKYSVLDLALPLIGVLCLWIGIVKIAEDAGLVLALVKLVRPLLGLIFPQIPKDHPALGMIALNLAANVLGLGNAATPMGLKAMEELQKLNREKDTATDSMCMFLAVNTASVQLVPPATLVAIMGVGAGLLWLPIIVVTGLSLIIAILAAQAYSLVPIWRKTDPMRGDAEAPNGSGFGKVIALLAGIVAGAVGLYFLLGQVFGVNAEALQNGSEYVAILIIPLVLALVPLYGLFRGVPVYESFVEGAKEGFDIAKTIIPYAVAILFAIGMFRVSGAFAALKGAIATPFGWVGADPELLPMMIARPLTGGGSLGVLAELEAIHGPDSLITKTAAVMYGSTETTFYVLAVYFGSVGIKKARHAVAAGLTADFAAMLIAVWVCALLLGRTVAGG
ncbi:MAG: nucleoside recognition domain-containing protein [Planctomycetota bacterium]